MDWTKAKNIIIIALIMTNLVLAGAIIYQNIEESEARKIFLQDTIDLLEGRNIHVDADIPKDQIKMPVLSVQYGSMDRERLNALLAEQEALPEADRSEQNIIDMTNKLLDQAGLMTNNVRFERFEKDSRSITVHYANIVNEIPVEDSYIKCIVRDGKIVEVNRLWLHPGEFGRNKKEVIPVAEALLELMNDNQEFDEIHIKKIELVYWLDTSSFDLESTISDTAFPAWKITYNNGKIKHVTAFRQ